MSLSPKGLCLSLCMVAFAFDSGLSLDISARLGSLKPFWWDAGPSMEVHLCGGGGVLGKCLDHQQRQSSFVADWWRCQSLVYPLAFIIAPSHCQVWNRRKRTKRKWEGKCWVGALQTGRTGPGRSLFKGDSIWHATSVGLEPALDSLFGFCLLQVLNLALRQNPVICATVVRAGYEVTWKR